MLRTLLLTLGLSSVLGCSDTSPLDGGFGTDDGGAQDAGALITDQGPRGDLGDAQDVGEEDLGLQDLGPRDGGAPGPGRFEDLAPMARGPRQETAVAELGGEIYVVGGFNDLIQVVDWVEAYDPGANTWRSAANLPAPLHHANLASVGGQLFVLGYLVGNFAAEGRAFSYAPALDQWSEVTSMGPTRARGASAVAVLDGLVYIIGGFRAGQAVRDVDVYDPMTDSWRPLPPFPRDVDHVVAAALDGKVYVAGGRAGGIGSHTTSLDLFDPSTNEWTSGPPMPTSRAGSAGALLNGRFYVFGGEGNAQSPQGVFEQVEVFDIAEGIWQTLTPMSPPRHGTGAAALDDRIYIPGGANVQAFGAVDLHQAFIP